MRVALYVCRSSRAMSKPRGFGDRATSPPRKIRGRTEGMFQQVNELAALDCGSEVWISSAPPLLGAFV